MPSRAHCEAIVRREREMLARGPMTHDEEVEFDQARAYEMHRAELRRHPEQVEPELQLECAA